MKVNFLKWEKTGVGVTKCRNQQMISRVFAWRSFGIFKQLLFFTFCSWVKKITGRPGQTRPPTLFVNRLNCKEEIFFLPRSHQSGRSVQSGQSCQGCILFNAIVHNSDITQALRINFCLLTLSDLGVSWVLEST